MPDEPARRLFFALWPSPETVSWLQGAVAPIQAGAPSWLRWQPADRWHVTVLFLGNRTRAQQDVAEEAGSRLAAATAALPLQLRGFGRFGSILWAGVRDAEWLDPLHRDLARQLQSHRDRERFRAHLSIARARGHRVPLEILDQLGDQSSPPWQPSELTLVASTIGPHPHFEVLRRFGFAG